MHNEIFNLLRAFVFVIIIVMLCSFCAAEKAQWTENEPAKPAAQLEPLEPIAPLQSDTPEVIFDEFANFTPSNDDSDFIRYPLTEEERIIVEAVVAAEAGGEDFSGQCLVALCILNTALATGERPSDVVTAPKQYAAPDYENRAAVREAVWAVFDKGTLPTPEPIRYFYAPKYCYSEWHEENLEFVLEYGGHRFFKEQEQ